VGLFIQDLALCSALCLDILRIHQLVVGAVVVFVVISRRHEPRSVEARLPPARALQQAEVLEHLLPGFVLCVSSPIFTALLIIVIVKSPALPQVALLARHAGAAQCCRLLLLLLLVCIFKGTSPPTSGSHRWNTDATEN
jgi:hypothetical protein